MTQLTLQSITWAPILSSSVPGINTFLFSFSTAWSKPMFFLAPPSPTMSLVWKERFCPGSRLKASCVFRIDFHNGETWLKLVRYHLCNRLYDWENIKEQWRYLSISRFAFDLISRQSVDPFVERHSWAQRHFETHFLQDMLLNAKQDFFCWEPWKSGTGGSWKKSPVAISWMPPNGWLESLICLATYSSFFWTTLLSCL